MERLNLPEYPFKISSTDGRTQIFDGVRKKYVTLTPEEWVRQHFVEYLVHEKDVPRSLIAVEMPLKYHKLNKRSDIVVYSKSGAPALIVECKAPHIKINQNVFDQIARYNLALQVPYLVVTNGMEHFCCLIDREVRNYRFLDFLPDYEQINR